MNNKIVLVGTGFVGMSFAYTLLNQRGIDELVLIDINKNRAEGEAMDLSHGLPFAANSKMKIYAGDYNDCSDANIIVITAGLPQKEGQTRLDIAYDNTIIMKEIALNIKNSGFNGIILVASNPVDIMTYVVQKVTKLPTSQVFGSGTVLDTARLKYLLGNMFDVNPTSIHVNVLGEHGDSSFVPWCHSYIGIKPLLEYVEENNYDFDALLNVHEDVKNAAYEVIEKKKATYYGIGLSLLHVVLSLLNNDDSLIPLSVYQQGEYGYSDMYIGTPAIINRKGVQKIVKLNLNNVDQAKFNKSADQIQEVINKIVDPLLNKEE